MAQIKFPQKRTRLIPDDVDISLRPDLPDFDFYSLIRYIISWYRSFAEHDDVRIVYMYDCIQILIDSSSLLPTLSLDDYDVYISNKKINDKMYNCITIK